MEPSYESDTDEETPLVSTPGNSLKTHDTRQAYEKKLAVFLILISILSNVLLIIHYFKILHLHYYLTVHSHGMQIMLKQLHLYFLVQDVLLH